MAATQRINREVVLLDSQNKFLTYPCKGVLLDGEPSVNGDWIWATFKRDGSACKVLVKWPKIA